MNRIVLATLFLVAAPALAQQPSGYPRGYPANPPEYPPAPIDSESAPAYDDDLPPRWEPPPSAPTVPQEQDDEPPPPPNSIAARAPMAVYAGPNLASPPTGSGALLELSAGGAMRSLYGAAIGGIDLAIHIGGEGPRGAWKITTTVLAGETDHRLPVEQVQWGFAAEGKIGRVRLGGGGQFGVLVVHRVTNGDAMTTPTIGIYGTGSIDLGASGARVMPFLALRLGVDATSDPTAILDGALTVGLRM